jgi:hypothetical protein
MSDVVLRCPNCGTTQESPGECDACHEASVRYFCPNHSPGRWLDGPVCAECGAREARERAAERGRTVPPIKPMPPASPPRSTPAAPPAATPPHVGPRRDVPPAVPRPGTPRRFPDSDADGPYTVPDPPRDVTRDITHVGARGEVEPPGWRVELPPLVGARALPTAIGCLKRLLVLALIGAILFAIASAWFFSSVIFSSSTPRPSRDGAVRLALHAWPWHPDHVAARWHPARDVPGTERWSFARDDAREAAATLAEA